MTYAEDKARLVAPVQGPGDMENRTGDGGSYAGGILHRLRTAWLKLLRVSDVRPDDDFFQCGGHSHLALQLTRELNKEFGLRLKLLDIYKNRTLGAQLELIESALAAIEVVK
jgi:aryl carrier-like protein